MAGAERLGEEIVRMCRDAGFAEAGICAASPSAHSEEFRRWLDAGRHGSMEWLAQRVEQRTDPTRFLPGAKSLIMVADQYAARGEADDPPAASSRRGRIARYARGDDYHRVMKKRLHALCDALRARYGEHAFRAFTDTAPVFEREHAMRAGLGWVAKHTLLIHPTRGSYLLLGGVATTLAVEPPEGQEPVTDHCGACTRCIEACPTDAITPYSVDATRCVSYLTIERRERIDPAFHDGIEDWLFGCDICQEVCPHNSPRRNGRDVGRIHPAYEPRRTGFDVMDVLGWKPEDRAEAFRGSALKRARLDMMKRNALIVAGNALLQRDDPALLRRVRAAAANPGEPDLVRETARDTLERLGADARHSFD